MRTSYLIAPQHTLSISENRIMKLIGSGFCRVDLLDLDGLGAMLGQANPCGLTS